MVMNKRADYMYLLISIILGLLTVSIIFFWIFGEGLTGDDIDFEACRQSIIARSVLPDVDLKGYTLGTFKDKFPLKCKTDVITIDYNDTQRAQKEVLDSMITCWQIMGNGEYSIFPSALLVGKTYCYNCARIHFAPETRTFYEQPGNVINIKDGLNGDFRDGVSYRNYLVSDNKNSFIAKDNYKEDFDVEVKGVFDLSKWWHLFVDNNINIYYPKTLNVSNGDFYITMNSWVYNKTTSETFLLFYNWNDGKALEELGQQGAGLAQLAPFATCQEWDGIPA
jgi:hypothetical protein